MTLIDKAEALAPCPFCGGEAELWNAHDNRPAWIACMGRCAVLISKEHATDAEAIAAWNRRAALPARGVGVPTEEDREWIDARADELFRANERIRGSVRPSTIRPQDFRDYFVVNATLERFAALAPTDAAQVREAALREAAEVAKSWYRQWAMYSGGNEPTRDDRAGGITYGRLQGAETIAAGILALIGEGRT